MEEIEESRKSVEESRKSFDISKVFSSVNMSGDKGTAKELLIEKDVKTKTELGTGEINLVARGFGIAKELDNDGLQDIATSVKQFYEEILILRISHRRKSRAEFIEAMRTELQQALREIKDDGTKIR